MKLICSFAPVLFATLLLPLAPFFLTHALAQAPAESASPRVGGPGGAGGEAHSPVQKQMGIIQRDYRKLTRQYADPAQKSSSLDLVAEMQKSAETAKGLTPSGADKKSDAEKSKYLDTYKKDLDALLKEIGTLKDAIDAGEKEKAKAELDKIGQLKSSSHKELGVKMGGGQKPSASPAAAAASPQS